MRDVPWTPGPWRYSLHDTFTYDDGSDTSRAWIGPAREGAPPILVTNSLGTADARLIAAAPEMAELLEQIASGTYPGVALEPEGPGFDTNKRMPRSMMRVRAAILLARIRGEADD